MPITDILEKNCRLYGDDVALVEINPEMPETKRTTWKEFDLIEPSRAAYYRREITWNVFNEKANRFANLLIERGIKKGEKVGIKMGLFSQSTFLLLEVDYRHKQWYPLVSYKHDE